MTNAELENHLYQSILPEYGEREANAIRRFLFSALHGYSSAQWLLIRHEQAAPELADAVNQAIPALLRHVPVQYIVGKTWFCDLEFMVKPGVLIPRPETEALVMMIAEKYGNSTGMCVLDIGTGSGAIAVSLAVLLDNPVVEAFDISPVALEVAAANARRHNRLVSFRQVDILDRQAWPSGEAYDLIVSNPPYVKESEKMFMQPNVLKYEPELALFVEDMDALKFYRAIAGFALLNLKPNGSLWFEINETEGDNIRQMLTEMGFCNIHILNDLHDKQRYACGRR